MTYPSLALLADRQLTTTRNMRTAILRSHRARRLVALGLIALGLVDAILHYLGWGWLGVLLAWAVANVGAVVMATLPRRRAELAGWDALLVEMEETRDNATFFEHPDLRELG